jgi:hypothetical protein
MCEEIQKSFLKSHLFRVSGIQALERKDELISVQSK